MVKLYLHYFSKANEPDTWDNQFADCLHKIMLQVADPEVLIRSNFNISGIEYINPNDLNIANYDAVVLIMQECDGIEWDEQNIPHPIFNAIENGQISKFFLVQKYSPLDSESLQKLKSILQYPFYELNYRTLQLLRYKPDVAGESEDGFWSRMSDLAYDIKYLVDRSNIPVEKNNNSNIYLAEVSKDQMNNYNKIRRELLLAGYNILPHYPLPGKLEDFELKVCELLKKSVLSVHILGELYGDSPEDSDYSFSELQNRVYDSYFNQLKTENSIETIQRIIWMPPVLEFPEEKQIQYQKRLRKEQFSKTNTEFVQCSITDLIKLIDTKYKRATSDTFEFLAEKEVHNNLLIITDSESDKFNGEFADLAKKYNFLFEILSYRSLSIDSVSAFMAKFKFIDSFVIINSNTGELWLQSMINNIVRSKGYSDAMPISSIGVFSNTKVTLNKQLIPFEIQEYPLNAENFKDQLELHISNLKS